MIIVDTGRLCLFLFVAARDGQCRQQVKNRVEDVMLFENLRQIALVFSVAIRCPYQKWYLVLHFRGQFHWHSVHKHIVLAQRLTVVGNEDHRALPVLQRSQGVNHIAQQIVGIENGVVVGVHQLCYVLLSLFYVMCHGLVNLKLFWIFAGVVGAVAGAGVDNYQHLVFLARFYALAQACKQQRVVALVYVRISLAQHYVALEFVDVYWWFAPVYSAPNHVGTCSEGVVR